jgi:hypothetical protein
MLQEKPLLAIADDPRRERQLVSTLEKAVVCCNEAA